MYSTVSDTNASTVSNLRPGRLFCPKGNRRHLQISSTGAVTGLLTGQMAFLGDTAFTHERSSKTVPSVQAFLCSNTKKRSQNFSIEHKYHIKRRTRFLALLSGWRPNREQLYIIYNILGLLVNKINQVFLMGPTKRSAIVGQTYVTLFGPPGVDNRRFSRELGQGRPCRKDVGNRPRACREL